MRYWKRSLQHSKCTGLSIGALCPWETNYSFANLLFFTSIEGAEAMLPSFATRYVAIKAFSLLLEALIATLLPAGDTAKEAIILIAIKLLIIFRFFFSGANGEQSTPPSCTSIDAYNAFL